MELYIRPDTADVAVTAAQIIADHAQRSIDERNRFTLAISGGRTPEKFLRTLTTFALPWTQLHLFQVDERIAPAGDPDRNLTLLQHTLLAGDPALPLQLHPMPVEQADPLQACTTYANQLRAITGEPPVLDLVQLGLGNDGHTASLLPGDNSTLASTDLVTVSEQYQGRQRMTLTLPLLNQARCILWVVTGADKNAMLSRLCRGDPSIPAGRIDTRNATIVADAAAAKDLDPADYHP